MNPETPEHGGLKFEELEKAGLKADQITDFSVSVNPYPLPESVKQAVRGADIEHYPDPKATLLRRRLAELHGRDPENFLVVNGTSQGMYLIASAFLHNEGRALICGPTYSEYFDACKMHQAEVEFVNAAEEYDFFHRIPDLCQRIVTEKPNLFWLCTPNNPTGTHQNRDEVLALTRCCRGSGTLLVLDEAYVSFAPEEKRYDLPLEGVLVLRSMTKDFRLAGIRLGYLMGEAELIARLGKWQPEWSVSSPAQAAGIACLDELEYFQETWLKTRELTRRFRNELKAAGFDARETDSNFFLIKTGRAGDYAAGLWRRLFKVRDCASFGLPDFLRVGTCSAEENSALVTAMAEVRAELEAENDG